MGETIYRGETLTVVLRCRDRAGEPVDMAGKAVDVVMTDRRERVLFRYSTHDEESRPLTVEGHFVLCRLESKDMSRLQGGIWWRYVSGAMGWYRWRKCRE